MPFDGIASGVPSAQNGFPAAARTATSYLDTNTGAEWLNNLGSGWQPNNSAVYKADLLATAAIQAALLVFTAPVTGIYDITAVVAQATSTSQTGPAVSVAYTDGDTGVAVAATAILAAPTLAAQGASASGEKSFSAKAGTTVTVSSTAPSAGSSNLHVRVSFLG